MAPPQRLILAIDQGTTSTRVLLFNHAGAIVGASQREIRNYFPAPAWVEHDAEEIYASVLACGADALAAAGATAADVVSVGITNQRETVLLWDAVTGAPLYHALVWQDQRGAPLCDALAAEGGGVNRFAPITGLPLLPYFSASKLAWLLDNVPGARAAAESGTALAGTVDAYLLHRLTGVHATDVSNASRTGLMNIRSLAWDAPTAAAYRIPLRCLPTIRPSSCRFGTCVETPGSPYGGMPVGGVLGDQQAALFGQACFAPGDAKATYGTGCFLLMNTGGVPVTSAHGLLTTVAYQLEGAPPVYALEGSVAVAGSVVSWLRDNLGVISSSSEVEPLAASVPDSGGVSFVPAFNGLFAPHWQSDARGLLIGLSGHTTKAHIVRAALEGVAFQARELLDAMAGDAGTAGRAGEAGPPPPLRVDGGMTANSLLLQFQADITGRVVVKPVVAETTALGAAYAAGLNSGFWASTAELAGQWKVGAVYNPRLSPGDALHAAAVWGEAQARSVGWASLLSTRQTSIPVPGVKVALAVGGSGGGRVVRAVLAGAALAAVALGVAKK